MWYAKLKIKHSNCWIAPKTIGLDITIKGVPLNSYQENGKDYHSNIIYLSGKDQDKLFNKLRKDKQVVKIVRKGNQIISLVEGTDHISLHFDKSFFFLKPVLIKDGYEYWELASWNKRKLNNFFETIRKFAYLKILKITKGFPQVFMQQTVQNLTLRQKDAFDFAKESGYYEYPRKASLEELAKRKKTPRTTYQSHLRKAEKKLMNVMLE